MTMEECLHGALESGSSKNQDAQMHEELPRDAAFLAALAADTENGCGHEAVDAPVSFIATDHEVPSIEIGMFSSHAYLDMILMWQEVFAGKPEKGTSLAVAPNVRDKATADGESVLKEPAKAKKSIILP